MLPNYDLGRATSSYLFKHGHHDTYRITTRQRPYLLRVYAANSCTADQIRAEIDLLNILATHDIPVPTAVPREDGNCLQAVNAPEGSRYAVLFYDTVGQPSQRLTAEQSRQWGQTTALLHTLTDQHAPVYDRPHYDTIQFINEPLAMLKTFQPYAHRKKSIQYLKEVAVILKDEVQRLPCEAPVYGLCHANLVLDTVYFTDHQPPMLTNFDEFGYSWRVYDLAIVFWTHIFDRNTIYKGRKRVRDAFLNGYIGVRSLSDDEQRALPSFVLLHHLRQLGQDIRWGGQLGINWMTSDYFDHFLQFTHEWLTKPW